MERTLIQLHASSIVRGFIERVAALSPLNHRLTKGELRELFVANILKSFLTSQFGIGSGIIINQAGKQSRQIDILIYDNRILPPFIDENAIGVYPAESVIACIEVKSFLKKTELMKAETAASELMDSVYNPRYSLYQDYDLFRPLCSVIGFYGYGASELKNPDTGIAWLNENVRNIFSICLTNRFSWLNVGENGWSKQDADPLTNEETKRFISVLLDNVRTRSEVRLKVMSEAHKDWLGIYTRDQVGIAKIFTEREE